MSRVNISMKMRIDPIDAEGRFDLPFYNRDDYKAYKKKLTKYLKDEGFTQDIESRTFNITFFGQIYEVSINN